MEEECRAALWMDEGRAAGDFQDEVGGEKVAVDAALSVAVVDEEEELDEWTTIVFQGVVVETDETITPIVLLTVVLGQTIRPIESSVLQLSHLESLICRERKSLRLMP